MAQTYTLTTDQFPAGTTVGAYHSPDRRNGQAPAGAAVDSATMGASSVTFTNLTSGAVFYEAYGLVSGVHRYVTFQVPQPLLSSGTSVGAVRSVEDYRGPAFSDTATLQAALDSLTDNDAIALKAGQTYTVKNLSIPDKTHVKLIGNGAKIVASSGAGEDTSYLIASSRWINNVSAASGNPYVYAEDLVVDATGRSVGWVVMSRRCHLHRVEVYGGDVNVKQDAQTKNGTDLGNNMVECRYTECSFHEATTYNFWSNDPTSYRSTDGFFEDNLCFNAGVANVKIDKFSGWHVSGLHTYQYDGGGFSNGAAFTPGSGWDLDITEAGVGGKFVDSMLESGLLRVRGITATHRPTIRAIQFGLTAPSGAFVDLRSTVTGGNNATVTLDDCEFYGPTSDAHYTTLLVTGPASGDPMRVYINGGHFGFRNPVVWSGQVKVFTRGVSLYQASQSVPADLIVDGFVPTSGARPPGIVHRTAAPSGGTEAFVVGDRWVHTAPAAATTPGGICVTAGSPGTWIDLPVVAGSSAAAYRRVAVGWQRFDAQATGTFIMGENSFGAFGGASAAKGVFYFDPADFAITGLSTKLKLRLIVLTNDVAPTSTFTATLVPISGNPSGAAATVAVSAGAAVNGSTATSTTPAADSKNVTDSGDFAAPVADYYALKLAISGASMAASSAAMIRLELLARNN